MAKIISLEPYTKEWYKNFFSLEYDLKNAIAFKFNIKPPSLDISSEINFLSEFYYNCMAYKFKKKARVIKRQINRLQLEYDNQNNDYKYNLDKIVNDFKIQFPNWKEDLFEMDGFK